jgi:alpha-tubulin suppressor-like RCC1 family protein
MRSWAGLLVPLAALALVPTASPEQASSQLRRLPAGLIDAGYFHTCAVVGAGNVRCWGRGVSGQLGYGNTNDVGDNEAPGSVGPVDLGAGRKAIAVAAGWFHTCALLDDGAVRCWGANTAGQLGYGNTSDIGDDEAPGSAGPVDLGAGRKAVAISAGGNQTCVILDNGRVRCWGFNGNGQLGIGSKATIGDDETPGSIAPVDLGAGRKAVAISVGSYHTCAILDNGRVRCWGANSVGQLGYGNTSDIGDDEAPGSAGPVNLGAGRKAAAISAGDLHTCAILDNGRVRCWGYGADGRLGYGNTNTIGDNEAPGSVSPVDLGAGRRALAISAGGFHSCAVLDNGAVRCWGSGGQGRLGYGNTNAIGDDETPGGFGPVDLAGRKAVAVSADIAESCALLDNGRMRCWGDGTFGELGYGNSDTIGDNETPGSVGPIAAGGLVATKARPTLSFTMKPRRDRRWPYALHASGKLGGFPADRATCSGLIQVRATTRGAARVAWKKLKLGNTGCTYSLALTTSRGVWKVTAAFAGNGSLKGRTARAKTFRAG